MKSIFSKKLRLMGLNFSKLQGEEKNA